MHKKAEEFWKNLSSEQREEYDKECKYGAGSCVPLPGCWPVYKRDPYFNRNNF